MDILKAFALLMQQEGIALTNNANDKGKLTKFGVSKASHPNVDIANLTQPMAINIYLDDYWTPAQISKLPISLQYIHFSCAVNCGIGSAGMILQRACGAPVDGIVGPGTIASCQNTPIQDYAIQWGLHYKKIIEDDPTQEVFKDGWNNRITTILDWYKAGQLN